LGIAVSKIRIGLVLSHDAGFLAELKKTIKYYIGSPLGSGSQWQSWIHIKDVARLFLYVAEEELDGIFNAVAPNPVNQKNLVKCIAEKMEKPLFLPPVPSPVLKLVLGAMANMITSSPLVVSKRLQGTDFRFEYMQVEKAIEDLIG